MMSTNTFTPTNWSVDPAYGVTGFEDGGRSSAPYRDRNRSPRLCEANGNTCRAYKTKGSKHCAGHNRSAEAGKLK